MTSERKWTPGPWEVVPLSGYGGPYAIRMSMPAGSKHPTHYGIQGVGNEANAQLIAAAPDLLEALTEAEHVMAKHIYPKPDVDPGHPYSVLKRVRAALAKAEGSTS